MTVNTRPSAFLEYVGEEPAVYRVRSGDAVETIPKSVRPIETLSGDPTQVQQRAARLLRWSIAGLLPAGLGAILLAPLAALSAMRAHAVALEPQDERRALVILGLSVLVLLAALPLAYLFWLHV